MTGQIPPQPYGNRHTCKNIVVAGSIICIPNTPLVFRSEKKKRVRPELDLMIILSSKTVLMFELIAYMQYNTRKESVVGQKGRRWILQP